MCVCVCYLEALWMNLFFIKWYFLSFIEDVCVCVHYPWGTIRMNLSCTILSFSALSSQTLLSCPALFSLLQDSPLSSCNLLSPPSLTSLLLHSPLFSLLLDYPFSSFTLLSLSPPALSFLLLHSLLYFLILYSPLFTLLLHSSHTLSFLLSHPAFSSWRTHMSGHWVIHIFVQPTFGPKLWASF